jgi:hypothetical protein
MTDLHRRDIHASKTRGPDAQEQVRHFLSQQEASCSTSEIRTKGADSVEDVAAHGHIRAERHFALLFEDEGRGAMILDRDRSPEIAAIEVEPARRLGLPNRADRAPGIDQRCVEPRQRSGRRIEPAVRDPDIVVCERDDLAFTEGSEVRARSTLSTLADRATG